MNKNNYSNDKSKNYAVNPKKNFNNYRIEEYSNQTNKSRAISRNKDINIYNYIKEKEESIFIDENKKQKI